MGRASIVLLIAVLAALMSVPSALPVHTAVRAPVVVHPTIEPMPARRGTGNDTIQIDGSFTDWTEKDCVYVDPVGNDTYKLNDGLDMSRDLMAAYVRIGQLAVYLRADFYDLSMGAELGGLDLYFAFDLCAGGNNVLPDYLDASWSHGWDLIVALYDTEHYNVYSAAGSLDVPVLAAYNAQWDSVELSVPMSAFISAGYSSGAAYMTVFTCKDGTNGGAGEIPGKSDITDCIPNDYPWEDGQIDGAVSTDAQCSQVMFGLLHHGNQFLKDVDNFIRDDNGMGFCRVPEIHEKWGVPVNLHVSGTLAEDIQWYDPQFNDYLRSLHDKGLAYMVGGFYTEYIPQYIPSEMNNWSMAYAKAQLLRYYNATTDACWVPERVYWDGWEDTVSDGGYSIVVVDTEDGFRWYGPPGGDEHRVYTAPNGVKILFISNSGKGGAPYNIQDQIHNNYDNGLSLSARELCVNETLAGDRYILYMDDWEKTCGNIPLWGGPEVTYAYDNSIGWLAQHQWINVSTLPEIAKLPSAGTIDVDDCTYFWIREKMYGLNDPSSAPTDGKSLYDAWYYDPTDSINDTAYNDYVPADTSSPLGDWKTPNTQIGDTWALVKGIKNTTLRTLAFKTMSDMLYETAWYENVWAHGNALELAYWEKEQAAHIRTAAMYAYADKWLAHPTNFTAMEDVDLDSEDEYVMASRDMYCVFEERGGKLVFAVDAGGKVLVGNTITGYLDERDAYTDAVTSTTTNTHYSGEYLGNAESAGSDYLRGSKVYAFESLGAENDMFTGYINGSKLRFSSGSESKEFTLSDNVLTCYYNASQGIRLAASPDLLYLSEIGNTTHWDDDTGLNFSANGTWVHFSASGQVRSVIMAYYFEVLSHSGALEMSSKRFSKPSKGWIPELLQPADGAAIPYTEFSWLPAENGELHILGDTGEFVVNVSSPYNASLVPGNYSWYVVVNNIPSKVRNLTIEPALWADAAPTDDNISIWVEANSAGSVTLKRNDTVINTDHFGYGKFSKNYTNLSAGSYYVDVRTPYENRSFKFQINGTLADNEGNGNGTTNNTSGSDMVDDNNPGGTGSEGNGNSTGGSSGVNSDGGVGQEDRYRICKTVLLTYVLPLTAIILMYMGIEDIFSRRKKRRDE